MLNLWPYLLRLAVASYFIYPHGISLWNGAQKLSFTVFGCINQYIPQTVAFTVWHGLFVVLGLLVLLLPRPILPLMIALTSLSIEIYVNFMKVSYTPLTMLLFVLILVTVSLIIYYSRPKHR